MSKVGIVTYYRNVNFGSALQACALQRVVKDSGYSCEHIRCFSGRSRKQRYLAAIQNPSLIPRKCIARLRSGFSMGRGRIDKFRQFVDENVQESEVLYTPDRLASTANVYDAFVCGSDQIWAPNLFSEFYYLSFVSTKHKKISYAPSIGLPVIPNNLKDRVAFLIKDIGYLSVREREGAQVIHELTGLDARIVLDPTLLLTRDQWLQKADPLITPDTPYALCLFLGENPQHRKAVEAYRRATGHKIAVLPFVKRDFSWGDVVMDYAGPREFLDLVNNASIIFTDSFHGAAFSVNFNKPFYVFMRFAENHTICQNSRIRNLLEIFGLRDRLLSDNSMVIEAPFDIDYTEVNEILKKERTSSLAFLQNSLRDSINISKGTHA